MNIHNSCSAVKAAFIAYLFEIKITQEPILTWYLGGEKAWESKESNFTEKHLQKDPKYKITA